MALRARLSPPREEQTLWPWHKAKCLALPASSLWSGERRMEAENYLSGGYGFRLAMEAKLGASQKLGSIARVWQPSRLKGIIVAEAYGTPFLAATQVFDLRPVPRKFLSLDKTDSSAARFIPAGSIMLTCSGSVGRATLATDALAGVLVSHDLLRIEPINSDHWGWVYAYLRSSSARAMMTSAQYGHIIKHLEPSHMLAMPVPTPTAEIAAKFQVKAKTILAARNKAFAMIGEAETLFEAAVGKPKKKDVGETGFAIRASTLMLGRRRLEGVFHNPWVRSLYAHFKSSKLPTESMSDMGFRAWLPGRFPRIPAQEGVQLVGSADLFEINPDLNKRIADIDFGDETNGRVKSGWLLMARSGQTYGINGTLAIANKFHEGKVISDDAIRIAPDPKCTARPGYVYTALSHPELGRPLVKAIAYGSSIPHIDVLDVQSLRVVRLSPDKEAEIADLAEESARLFASADILENEMSVEVDSILGTLLAIT
jgi:hypothetical protein